MQWSKIIINGLLCLLVTDAIRITKLNVPSTYSLENSSNPSPLVLDCEYELQPNETGFVLKWYLNDQLIYQWIPDRSPYALSLMKKRVNISYAVSDDKNYKYRAIAITNPTWNMSGDYTCMVQTFESMDKRKTSLKIIVPESRLQLGYDLPESGNYVDIKCIAYDIYPQPIISLFLDEMEISTTEDSFNLSSNGLYSYTTKGHVRRDRIESPTNINCALTLPGTGYRKRREAIYYDPYLLVSVPPSQNPDQDDYWEPRMNYVSKGYMMKLDGTATILLFILMLILYQIGWRFGIH